jgi:hypothetical protein
MPELFALKPLAERRQLIILCVPTDGRFRVTLSKLKEVTGVAQGPACKVTVTLSPRHTLTDFVTALTPPIETLVARQKVAHAGKIKALLEATTIDESFLILPPTRKADRLLIEALQADPAFRRVSQPEDSTVVLSRNKTVDWEEAKARVERYLTYYTIRNA